MFSSAKRGAASRSRRRLYSRTLPPSQVVEQLEDRTLLAGMWSDGPGAVQVSQATVSDAEYPDVAIASDGRYVVVWEEGGDIKFRRFTPIGDPLDTMPRSWLEGSSTRVAIGYGEPSVAMAADGSFVVVFTYSTTTIAGTTSTGIGFTRFQPDGTPLGAPSLFSTTDTPSGTKVAATYDGRFVIAWQEQQTDGSYSVAYDVFDTAGNSTVGYQYAIESIFGPAVPDVAVNPVTGKFAIVYEAGNDVFRKLFSADGLISSNARLLQQDTVDPRRQLAPSVAMNAAGDVFYAWIDYATFLRTVLHIRYGQENYYSGYFDMHLWPAEATVASVPSVAGGVSHPKIATTDRRDTIVITWIESDSSGSRVMTKQFNLATNPEGEPVRPSPLIGRSGSLAVAMNARGDYVLAYDADVDLAGGIPSEVYAETHRFQAIGGIGIFRDGVWSLDLDFDNAYGYGDTSFEFGLAGDLPVVGDWDGDGFSNVGVFRDGIFYLDFDGNFHFDRRDLAFAFGLKGDQPVVGDWNGDGRDDIGVFRDGDWYLDANGSYEFDLSTDAVFTFGLAGDTPVVTDLFNEGRPIWGVFRNGVWSYDRNLNGSWDTGPTDVVLEFGLVGDQPVSGNWFSPDPTHRTGIETPAVFRSGTWSLDLDEDRAWSAGDSSARFGTSGDKPVSGVWSLLAVENYISRAERDEVGVSGNATWTLDSNSNQSVDGFDLTFDFGNPGHVPISGDFNNDGFDEFGLFQDGLWLIDMNGNRLYEPGIDLVFTFGTHGDLPIVGDFDGYGGDQVGVFRNGRWYLQFSPNPMVFDFGGAGDIPVAGDWNGDGRDEVGIYRDGQWTLNYAYYGIDLPVDPVTRSFVYGSPKDKPAVGDWNGDGFDDVGVKRGVTWFLDRNGNDFFDAVDAIFTYGGINDFPLAGRWPITL